MTNLAHRPVHALLALVLSTLPLPLLADTDCTDSARSTWIPESQFREKMKHQGVQITKFRITPGNCYEIYGFDDEGRKLEVYYNPVDARPIAGNHLGTLNDH